VSCRGESQDGYCGDKSPFHVRSPKIGAATTMRRGLLKVRSLG
jgi:hypothetical protein